MLKTTNGGSSWNKLGRGFGLPINDLLFPVDANTGYAASSGVVMKTTDAGVNWTAESMGRP